MNHWDSLDMSTDPVEELKKCFPISFACLERCISKGAVRCVRWLLATYPALVHGGRWTLDMPLEIAVSRIWEKYYGSVMPEMVLLLLEAGAEHTERFGKGNVLDLLIRFQGYYDAVHVHVAAKHLVDYGAWVAPECEVVGLRAYWERCYCQRAARVGARKALYHRMRAKGMPRDVAKLVVLAAPLSDALSWKEWEIEK
jgi:hypothetical protein